MPFMFKLSLRWSRFRTVVVAATLAVAACELRRALTSVAIDRVEVSSSTVTVHPHQTTDFIAVALDSHGDTADVAVNWSATAGSLTDLGGSDRRQLEQYHHRKYRTFRVIAASEHRYVQRRPLAWARPDVVRRNEEMKP